MKTLGSKQVYVNRWMAVREDAVRRSDGSTGTYCVVEASDIALIIPADGPYAMLETVARADQLLVPVGDDGGNVG